MPEPDGDRASGMGRTLILVIASCALLSAAVNLWHAHASLPELVVAAPHLSMQEFAVKSVMKSVKDDDAKHKASGDDDDEGAQEAGDDGRSGEEAQENEPLELVKDDIATPSAIGGLKCDKFGGPPEEIAAEMVYWEDIVSDRDYVSPFHPLKNGEAPRYMTFEPDGGGWNNIRMAMETVVGLAIATGRILVMPPAQRMYLLGKDRDKQNTHFSFAHFFPVEELAMEHKGLEVITMKEFLEREAMTGHLRYKENGEVAFPPQNMTDWDGGDHQLLKEWLRNVTHTPLWSPTRCLAAFPASGDHKDVKILQDMLEGINQKAAPVETVLEDPLPVDATPVERMQEGLAGRNELCVYDEEMQKEHVVHFMCYHKMRVRMLVHFYAFLYFEDWREDLWLKRFMRDHMRYIDEIQCAAARIVAAMRDHVRSKSGGDPSGAFDTFHVRRGDFQYKRTRIDANEIYINVADVLPNGTSLYIATDERDKSFFDPLRQHYDVKTMDDFKEQLEGVNTNYYGMIDQLVASRGRIFFGCFHSTFTGFIDRMRGYHSVKDKAPGHEKGLLPTSYYYVPVENKFVLHKYAPLHGAFFNREFPTSWRDLNKGVGQIPSLAQA